MKRTKRYEIELSRGPGWCRFGGGFNWALGFEAGGRTLIINLLTFSVSVRRRRP